MKFLVVALVLAIFAGSEAFILRDEPYSQLDKLKEFQEYVKNFTWALNDHINFVIRFKISQSVVDQLREVYSKVKQQVHNVTTELPAEVRRRYEQAVGVSLGVVEKGLRALRSLKNRVTPATEKLAASLYDIVVPYANLVLQKVDSYSEAARRSMTEAAGKLKNPKLVEKLKQQLEQLSNQLAPYTSRLQNQLEEFQASLEPYASPVGERFKQGLKKIKRTFQPLVSSVLEALRKYTEDFKQWVWGSPAVSQDQ